MNAMRAALMERDANLARLQNEARMQVENAERARVPPLILPDSIGQNHSVTLLNL